MPVDILDIQLELLLDGETAAAADLSQTGKAWFDEEPATLVFVPLGNLAKVQRPWAYHRQVAFYDIPELWEFVEGGITQNPADGDKSGIGAALG